MESVAEKIFVHDGIQMFTESSWTAQNHSSIKIFLLLGLREKEILSAFQTTQEDLANDIENIYLYYPWNTKIVGLYIQYSFDRPNEQINSLIEMTLSNALSQRILPLQNFLIVLRDHKTLAGTGVSFKSILQEQYEFSLVNYNSQSAAGMKYWEERRIIKVDIEASDLKREQIMSNFFYIQVSQQFQGFDQELREKQDEYLEQLENPKNLVLVFKQLGSLSGQGQGLIQNYQQMGEEFGKRLNIEAKKLIKANKEKQQSYTLINMELYDLGSIQNQSLRCPSYQLEHTSDKNFRKIDINIIGIFLTSDNLHDQLDLFMKHCKRILSQNFFKRSLQNNIMLLTYNLRESALLQSMLNIFDPSEFYQQSFKKENYIQQRKQHTLKYCYEKLSPRLMAQNAIQTLKGWGCAYRSLQTLISYFKYEGYAPGLEIPTHKEIQEALVSMEDKEKNIIGSNQWIGAFEIECKIMNVTSGLELQQKGRELRDHFINEGTPIMIGGDLYAYTILGIDFCEELDDLKFLILDPHYPGNDGNIKNVLQKGWCGWKDVTMFKADAFYNLCMPQKPQEV